MMAAWLESAAALAAEVDADEEEEEEEDAEDAAASEAASATREACEGSGGSSCSMRAGARRQAKKNNVRKTMKSEYRSEGQGCDSKRENMQASTPLTKGRNERGRHA